MTNDAGVIIFPYLNIIGEFAKESSQVTRIKNIRDHAKIAKIDAQGAAVLKGLGKSLSYTSFGLGIAIDFSLSLNNQQDWSITWANGIVSTSALIIGGWWGIGLEGSYILGKQYLNQIIKHPNWAPYNIRGFNH